MNKTYRVSWSASRGAWMVAPETARRKGKGHSLTIVCAIASGLLLAAPAWADTVSPSGTDNVYGVDATDPGVSTNQGNTAYGAQAGAKVTGSYNTAIGYQAGQNVNAIDTVSIGKQATASANDAIAIGTNTKASGPADIYMGLNAGAGAGSTTSPDGTVTLGIRNMGLGESAGSYVTGQNNTGIGYQSGMNVTGDQNVGLGQQAGQFVTGTGNSAMGHLAGSTVSGSYNAAFGEYAGTNTSGGANAAFGFYAGRYINGTNNTALGAYDLPVVNGTWYGSYVTGSNNLGAGHNSGAYVSGASNVGLGDGAGTFVTGSNNVAIGTAAGSGAYTSGPSGATLNAALVASNTVSIGTRATASQSDAIAIGKGATASGAQSISIGTGNVVSGKGSGAIGDPSTVSGAGSYSIGNNNTVANSNTFVLGNGVTTTQDNSVVLGNQSTDRAAVAVSSETINGTTYNYAGVASPANGVVSIGGVGTERQLINVAAGQVSATSTDAINGSQLYATNQAVIAEDAKVNSLGGGVASALGGNAAYNATTGAITAPSYAVYGTTQNSVGGAIDALQALAPLQYTSGPGVTTPNAPGSVPTNTVTLVGAGGPGANTTPVTLTNVAPGKLSASSTDAVNGSQLYATNQQVANLVSSVNNGGVGPVQYSDPSAPTTPNGGKPSQDLTLVGAASGPVALHNVAPGTASTDAVNVGQLGAVTTGLGGGAAIDPKTGAVTAPSYTVYNADGTTSNVSNVGAAIDAINSTGIKYFHANSTKPDSQALGADSVAIGPNAVANNAGDVALGSGAVTSQAGGTLSETINGVTYSFAGTTPIGTVSVGAPGVERTITNVAAGRIGQSSTDAINGSQLYGTNQSIEALTDKMNSLGNTVANTLGSGASYNPQTGAVNGPANSGGVVTPTVIQEAANKWVSANPSTYVAPVATGTNGMAVGSGAVSTGQNSVALGTNASDGGRSNVVSVGAPGAERQVTNVAAGTQATDAVNLGQMNGALAQQTDSFNQRLGAVQQDVDNVARAAYGGIAAATALTMIPEVDKDKTIAVGIGGGTYRGYQAVALGATARITENIKVRAGVGMSSGGTTAGIGASMQW